MSKKTTLPPETFRIRPRKGCRPYFIVHIAEDRQKLKQVLRTHTGYAHPEQLACVVSAASATMPGFLGMIFFSRQDLGVGIVAHELAHAAFRACEGQKLKVKHWRRAWLWSKDIAGASEAEETYCAILEHLNRSFWALAYEKGIVALAEELKVRSA